MTAHLRLTVSALALFIASVLQAQISFDGITAYTQNFDTLPGLLSTDSNTQSFTFTNNSTLPGWWTSVTGGGYSSSGSTQSSGKIFSWGSKVANIGDREQALGLHTGNSNGYSGNTEYLGLQLQNTSGTTINSVTLSFTVEQWRKSTGSITQPFSWLVTAAAGNQLTSAGYTADTRGDATSLVTDSSSSGLNGNIAANRDSVSVMLTGLNWKAGEYLWLRWSNSQTTNTVAAIALDDLKVELTSIPEPALVSSILALAVASIALFAIVAKRRH